MAIVREGVQALAMSARSGISRRKVPAADSFSSAGRRALQATVSGARACVARTHYAARRNAARTCETLAKGHRAFLGARPRHALGPGTRGSRRTHGAQPRPPTAIAKLATSVHVPRREPLLSGV